MIMESHPLALMEEGRAFSDFCADIAEHGLREPIITYEGKVLDGRNIEKGIPPTFREWTGPGSPLDLVISLNLQRRHLTQSQRAMIAARLATLPPWRPGKSASIAALSQNEAGERLDVSRESVQRARKVLNSAIPELVAAVDRGDVKVSQAATITDMEPAFRRTILQRLAAGAPITEACRDASPRFSNLTPEHFAPKAIVDAARNCMGGIDLDPCPNPGSPNVEAKTHFTEKDNGLRTPWRHPRVFLNRCETFRR